MDEIETVDDGDALPDVQVVVAHRARATLRVGDVFLKVDPDRAGIDAEVAAMAAVAVPTPRVLWRRHPVLAIERVRGAALATFGQPSPVGPASWVTAGAAVRSVHRTPLPTGAAAAPADGLARRLEEACAWFLAHDVVPADVVRRNRELALLALRPRTPCFTHGDLQPDHVFVEDDVVTGVIDWSGAGAGDPLLDIAVLTLGHPEHLDDVVSGYRGDVDRDLVRAWWAYRCLTAVPWLAEHGFGPPGAYPETAVLLAAAR
ncbi:aminoglycoside phosphotransferase family protein [Pseudokineococcus sp. 5B2Z-1]|uniref:aminoglycoside phosphotransferase family protein n=1 Tax=Pseudokineococcus sp. 5B2Z-1 TaxID=3132744 RepID=UPI0030A29B67